MNNPTLNFQIDGDGPPLLVVHGLFGSGRNWHSLARRWAQQFCVIRVDLRNHGESFHSEDMSYPAMAMDLHRLVQSLGLDSVSLLGHSMGGKAAMMFSHMFPDSIDKLIVADIAPVAYAHDHDNLVQPLIDLDLGAIHKRGEADKALNAAIPNSQIRQFLLQNLENTGGRFRWKLNLKALQRQMPEITGFASIDDWMIKRPTLFIRGENSDYLLDEHWQTIRQHFPNATRVTLKNAGHWLHFEQADAFYSTVVSFLEN